MPYVFKKLSSLLVKASELSEDYDKEEWEFVKDPLRPLQFKVTMTAKGEDDETLMVPARSA